MVKGLWRRFRHLRVLADPTGRRRREGSEESPTNRRMTADHASRVGRCRRSGQRSGRWQIEARIGGESGSECVIEAGFRHFAEDVVMDRDIRTSEPGEIVKAHRN